MWLKHYGEEFKEDPRLNIFHKIYISIFGIPISGLRIRLRRILPEIQGSFTSIVDLGCGKGVFTMELARRFPKSRVVGVDTDAEQVRVNNEVARRKGLRNVEFVVQDILTMSFDSEFDLALSVDNLEHIENDVEALARIRRALKPGGKLVCHVPALERIWIFRKMARNFDVEGHVRAGYRLQELETRMREAGFNVKEIKPTYGYLETVSNNISYLITGASQKNALLYAFAFPVLNAMAWFGRKQNPKSRGAGVLAHAVR